ncbi:uncharacterized protein isoform X2 [Danio rerio]|uniref:Uncharacterized protein isoform X2 n=1 Tax=Danio rerio TaxID=7955 RepID=A0AC58HCP6_DANRE
MGIGFIFFLFGLTVSAKKDDLQGFQSLQTDSSAAFITTVPPEEQNSSSDNGGKVSSESPARLTGAVISSPGTDLFHTPHKRQHSSTVNATTATDKDAITSNGPRFVLIYDTGLHSTSSALKPFQSEEDPTLVSTDEKRLHPSMSDDTVTPAAHLSRGKEKISAFFHASLESKNQRVLESITLLPANGIPLVSASDPAIIDNLGESNESVERRPENKKENWTLESFRADDPLNSTEEASLNKNHSTIMHFGILQGAGLLTSEIGQNPRNESEREPKEEKNLLSQSSLILDTPLQVESTSQVMVNKMTESSKNLKHPGLMVLFSASKLTPTKTPVASTANYFSSIITAAGEMHVIKLLEASQLISDSVHRTVSARDGLERKLILHTKSRKELHIKPTLQTSPIGFLHQLTSQKSLLFNKTPDLCAKVAKMPSISVKETHSRIDHSTEQISFSTASFTNTVQATTAGDMLLKQTQSSLTTPQTLSPQTESSKHSDQFDELSTAVPLLPLTKPKNVFQVFKVNDHRFLPERLKPFVSFQAPESIPPSFTSTTVTRLINRENVSQIDSSNQNQHLNKVLSIVSERPNMILSRLSKHKMVNTTTVNKSMSSFVLPTHLTPKDNTYTMFSKPQVYISNISNTLPLKKYMLPTSLSKSQNTVTTDAKRVLSKLLSISKKSNSESDFLYHSVTTRGIGSLLDDKQQDLKSPRGTVRLLFGSHTVSSIPSVQQPTEAHPREGFLTETAQSELQIEPYLKKSDGAAKPTKLIPNSRSVAGIYQTPLTSISHPSTEFKQDLSFTASPLVSIEQNIGHDYHKESVLPHHELVNVSTLLKHPWKITSNRISGISRHKTAAARPEGALNPSPLESSTSLTSPLFHVQTQNVLHKEHLSLTEDQTQFLSTLQEHSQTTQSNFALGVTEDAEKQLGWIALSAVTGEKLSSVVHTDLSFSSTETQSLPKGSLQSRGGSADISHGATPFAESDSARSAELESDLPVINTKMGVIAADSLSGLAQISDDICGSGNYTAEMSLNLERDIMPGDLIPALGNLRVVISLKTNNSQVNLEIKSCCLSPTVRLDEFNTTCCIFSRLPIDPHGIRLLPGVPSKKASFTISLFQMINYSSAYLHCDLSVCLRNHSDCERCVQRRNAHLQEEAGGVFSRMGNRISFGPVLKGADNSSFSEAADDTEAVAVIISSVAGCLLACLALSLVWMANRRCLQRSAYCWSRASCEC